MKEHIGPRWSREEQARGERLAKAWEEHFVSEETAEGGHGARPPTAEEQRISAVQARHEDELLRYPNVVGVATGIRARKGRPTGERCLVVYVERKVPSAKLAEHEILPREIDGVPVDVVEVGKIGILPG